jgi:hypothetical protein
MNSRIGELKDLAWATCDSPETYMDKFAELIVLECMAVSEDVANAAGQGPWFEGYISGVEEVNRRTKQHFGVK